MKTLTDLSPQEKYSKFVRPELGKILNLLKLDVVYSKACSDKLEFIEKEKTKVVYDFLGGFGSTILGHNHPELTRLATDLLGQKVPIHTQASTRAKSADLAEALNFLIQKHTADTRLFITTLTNSGTEAVEAAIKHALLEWNQKKSDFILKIKAQNAREPNSLLENYIKELESLKPLLLAVEGSFHGKTAASVAATANDAYRSMYRAGGLFDVSFLNPENSLEKLENLIGDLDCKCNLASFSRIIGFIFEPIQGEGGINELASEFLQGAEKYLRPRGVPLICDEIQSGLYRTGSFLAVTRAQVRPDYILLGKSLGGGLAKIGAVLVAREHYQDHFGWIHTSTFAEDDFSSALALKTLDILETHKDDIEKRAIDFYHDIKSCIDTINIKFPKVIKKFKGRGFFLGIEFSFEESTKLPDLLHGFYENGHATYFYMSYLLRQCGVRVGVTLSAPETIRIEPSVFISAEAKASLVLGLERLCQILYERKVLKLTSHLWKQEFSQLQLEVVAPAKEPLPKREEGVREVGFLTHVLHARHARDMCTSLKPVALEKIDKFLADYANQAIPFKFHRQKITGRNGEEIFLNIYGLFLSTAFFEKNVRGQSLQAFQKTQDAVKMAAADGVTNLGLGQFTSIVSDNGLLLDPCGTYLTTGNSLTAAMAVQGILSLAEERKFNLANARLGVVGFSGNICHVISQLLADSVKSMTLIHREPIEKSPKFQKAVEDLLVSSKILPENLKLSHHVEDLRDCDVVVVGTNSTQEFIRSSHIKSNAIVLDVSVPSNIHREVWLRSDVACFQGGLARLPNDQKIQHPWIPYTDIGTFSCIAETVSLGLAGIMRPFSLGKLSKLQILESLEIAKKVGVGLAGLRPQDSHIGVNPKSDTILID
ncbi:MAG: hypothetical protein A4S09_13785 [Proteobacteria bacterium SG_bin7]|nr:MAG: hypothetical protein A4S09_13785 [Proteobacteria bacterium SG_bin7]